MLSSTPNLLSALEAGAGHKLNLRRTKKEGIPVQLVPAGTPGASVVGVKRVDELGFYNLSHRDLAAHVDLTPPKTTAAAQYLNLYDDPECFKEIVFGRSRFKRYSQVAIPANPKLLHAWLETNQAPPEAAADQEAMIARLDPEQTHADGCRVDREMAINPTVLTKPPQGDSPQVVNGQANNGHHRPHPSNVRSVTEATAKAVEDGSDHHHGDHCHESDGYRGRQVSRQLQNPLPLPLVSTYPRQAQVSPMLK